LIFIFPVLPTFLSIKALLRLTPLPIDEMANDPEVRNNSIRKSVRDHLGAQFIAVHVLGLRMAAIGTSGYAIMRHLPPIPLQEYNGYEATRNIVYETLARLNEIRQWVDQAFPGIEKGAL
jgi:hypothetical protein